MDLDEISHEHRFKLSQERLVEKSLAKYGLLDFFLFYAMFFALIVSKWLALVFLLLFIFTSYLVYSKYKQYLKIKRSQKDRIILNLILLKNYLEQHIKSKTLTQDLSLARERLKITLDSFKTIDNYLFVDRGFGIDKKISQSFSLLRIFLKTEVKDKLSHKFDHNNLKILIENLNKIIESIHHEDFSELIKFFEGINLHTNKIPLHYRLWDKFYKLDLKENVFTLIFMSIILAILIKILFHYQLFKTNNLISIFSLIFGAFVLYNIIKPFSSVILEKIDKTFKK
ncbi:hypothetical protein HYX03_01990 [Candidatus Woesearchaeota archaeon]|nr:hypothetical protein [Candidatus Woesearchaeota archaeon]